MLNDAGFVRHFCFGGGYNSNLLVVANLFFSDSGEEIIRIISARPANSVEVKQYENT